MELDELVRILESVEGALKYQFLNNLDDLLAPLVRDGKIDKKALEMMVKRPLMQQVTKLKSLRVTLQNPGLARTATSTSKETCP